MYRSDAVALLQLAAVLEGVALVALLVAGLAGFRVSRRQAGRLAAIDFVRATFAFRLAEGDRLDELLPQVVQALSHAFALDAAEVWLVAARSRDPEPLLESLTPRERQVLSEVAEGHNNAAIAGELFLTERAVEKHINSIFSKLNLSEAQDVHRRVKAVLLFLAKETSEPDDR